jgi:hypothetical protein
LARPKRGAPAERRSDVPYRDEVAHLVDRDIEDRAAPACDRFGFRRGKAFAFTVLQAEGGVEIGAHQILLELRGFVERMQNLLATHGGFTVHFHNPPDTAAQRRHKGAG